MARIENSSIEALRENLDIVNVVGNYIQLRKSGANYKAKCPFHEEKSPSFMVSPQKQIYHCFGCGAGGNAITFVQEYEGLSFPEAVEELAGRYNFQLEYSQNFEKEEKSLLSILETLNLYFQENLQKRRDVLDYLFNRGVTPQTIHKFRLGYAPDSYDILSFLHRREINFSEAEEVGVVAFDDNGNPYSRFVERVTFPIFSGSGKIVAFGGRTLGNHPAKYLNSPTTKYFNKSKVLYGYNFAKKEMFRKNSIIFVEGYLDVIAMNQAGFENVVAPLGTAFTEGHLPLVKRGENLVVTLAFDGDSAGVEATKRALDILLPVGVESRVVLFDGGVDPADLVKNGEVEKLKKLLEGGKDAVKFYLQNILSKHDMKNPYDRARAISDGREFLEKLPQFIRDEYNRYFAEELLHESPEKLVSHKKIETRESEKGDFFGHFELSLIRSILENGELLSVVEREIGENGFLQYGDIYRDLKRGEESQKIRRISLMECNFYDENEIEVEVVNYKIRRVQKEMEELPKSSLPFGEKSIKIRENRYALVSLQKRKRALEMSASI
jgi:DNA primase